MNRDRFEEDLIALSRRYVYDRLLCQYGHVIPRHAHEDEFQAAFEYLWERRHTFDPNKGRVSTWVYSVLHYWLKSRHNERSKWRAADPEEVVPLDPQPVEIADGENIGTSPLELLGKPLWHPPEHELSELAQRMLDDLEDELVSRQKRVAKGRNRVGRGKPQRAREAVEMHLAYGASAAATAECMGISPKSVERYVADARQILRAKWGHGLHGEGRLAA